jgi:hypothetical protein
VQRVGEHPVPTGPLAPRWIAHDIGSPRAGVLATARLRLENAGTATWRSRGKLGMQLAYHWLDPLGNPIVWDGIRTSMPHPIVPGEVIELDVPLLGPRPPGPYTLAFDFVEERHFWFAEIGSPRLEIAVDVGPRISERRLAVSVHGGSDPETDAALAAQEEPLVSDDPVATAHVVPGAVPSADWSRRILDTHAEGYAAVGGAIRIEDRSLRRRLRAWAPGGGRNPSFEQPLLLPSLLAGLEPGEHEGLPAFDGEDALFDGRIVVRLRRRSDRPRG